MPSPADTTAAGVVLPVTIDLNVRQAGGTATSQTTSSRHEDSFSKGFNGAAGVAIFIGFIALAWLILSWIFSDPRLTRTGGGVTISANCAVPVTGTDAKGRWYGVGGTKYRMDVGPAGPSDLLCGNGSTAYWKSTR